jgi:enolase
VRRKLTIRTLRAREILDSRGCPTIEAEPLLPVPMLNVVNGGRHAAGGLDFQELMIVPIGAGTFAEALRAAAESYWGLREVLAERGLSTAVGDEGGFSPALRSVEDALECIIRGIERAGYRPGVEVALALDPAASEFHRDRAYVLARAGGGACRPGTWWSGTGGWSRRTPSSASKTASARRTRKAGRG